MSVSAEPRLQTTLKQLGLESSRRHTQVRLKLNNYTRRMKEEQQLQLFIFLRTCKAELIVGCQTYATSYTLTT